MHNAQLLKQDDTNTLKQKFHGLKMLPAPGFETQPYDLAWDASTILPGFVHLSEIFTFPHNTCISENEGQT